MIFDKNNNVILLELILCAVLVSLEVEGHSHIQPFSFVPERPHWSLSYKGFTFLKKKNI